MTASQAAIVVLAAGGLSGGLSGRVILGGSPPATPGRHPVVRDRRACGSSQPDETLVLGSGGALANVVVTITDLPAPRPQREDAPPLVDQIGCRFVPHVLVAAVGETIAFGNSDPVLHNIHAYRGEETLFNLGFPLQGQRRQKSFDAPETIELRCDAGHDWMRGWVVVTDHPFAVTGTDGRFTFPSVPAGRHHLHAWHESLGTRDFDVDSPPPPTLPF